MSETTSPKDIPAQYDPSKNDERTNLFFFEIGF